MCSIVNDSPTCKSEKLITFLLKNEYKFTAAELIYFFPFGHLGAAESLL